MDMQNGRYDATLSPETASSSEWQRRAREDWFARLERTKREQSSLERCNMLGWDEV
jgi:hypothetical protein